MTRPTKDGPTRPLVSGGSLSGDGGTLFGGAVGSGLVPTSSGSNTWAWASNVARITSNGSNALLGPFVNFQSGAGISFAAASNTLTISGSGGGGDSSLPWVVVTEYGAVGDGSTDDLDAINDAITALNAAGSGVLYFPAVDTGDYYYVSDGLDAITVPCLILGDGGGSSAGVASPIATDHATAFLFTLSASNIRMSGLRLVNFGGSETDGAAVQTTTGFGNYNRYDHLWVEGFRDGMSLLYGGEWSMMACHITNPVRYGLRIANIDLEDGGDWSIANSWFGTRTRDATTAIRQESAGGGKLVNVKINANAVADQSGGVKRYVTGYHAFIDGSTNTTSVGTIVGCSIENVSGDAIHLQTNGTGQFSLVAISGLQVGLYTNNTGRAVKVNAASAGGIGTNGGLGNVVIDGLTARTDGTARAAVELVNADRTTLGDFTLSGFNARYTGSGDTNTIDGGGGVTELDDLTDVTITAPAEDDDLRYDGSVWVNDARKWEAVTDGEDVFVWDGDDLVHEWNA